MIPSIRKMIMSDKDNNKDNNIDDLLSKFLVYFDASRNITLDTGSNISQWVDIASGLVASQATASAQPLISFRNGQTYVDVANNGTRWLTVNIPTPLNINTSRAYFCYSNCIVVCTINIPNSITTFQLGRTGNLLNTIIFFNGFPSDEENQRITEFLKRRLIYNSQSLDSLLAGEYTIVNNTLPRRITEISNVISSGVSNLTYFVINCQALTSFPLMDTSNVTSFHSTWHENRLLTSFPLIDTSNGIDFYATWFNCNKLISFPLINVSKGTTFESAWGYCTSLANFPANFFDNWVGNPTTNCFYGTWEFCKLNAQSVENILVSIAFSGKSAPAGATGTNITINYDTTTGSLSTATTTAISTLKSRGWKPNINGVYQ